MRKWPIAIVMILLALGVLVAFWLMFPMYYIKTEGYMDTNGDGDFTGDPAFTVEETYYLDHYQAESNYEMFDKDGDGVLESRVSPSYSYDKAPITEDGKTTNNYGWKGSVEKNGQPAKANVFTYSFFALIACLVLGGLTLIIIPLSGLRLIPPVIPKILGVLFVIAVVIYPLIMLIFLPGAWADDDREYYKVETFDTVSPVIYEDPGVCESIMGKLQSESRGGKDFNYYTEEGYQPPMSAATTQDYRYMEPDPLDRTWDTYWGVQSAAGYIQQNHEIPNATNVNRTTVFVQEIEYRPSYYLLGMLVVILFGIIGWAMVDQNPPKEYDYGEYRKNKEKEERGDYRDDQPYRDGRPRGDAYHQDRYERDPYGRDPYARDRGGGGRGGGRGYDDYDRGRQQPPRQQPPRERPPREPPRERGGPRLGPQ